MRSILKQICCCYGDGSADRELEPPLLSSGDIQGSSYDVVPVVVPIHQPVHDQGLPVDSRRYRQYMERTFCSPPLIEWMSDHEDGNSHRYRTHTSRPSALDSTASGGDAWRSEHDTARTYSQYRTMELARLAPDNNAWMMPARTPYMPMPNLCEWPGSDNYHNRGQIENKSVNCSPCIDHKHVAHFTNEYYDSLTDNERKLLQETLSLVLSMSRDRRRWVWKHSKITVYGERMQTLVVFYSGDKTNKFVVHLNRQNESDHALEERGWRLFFHDVFVMVWNNVGSAVGGALASFFTRAISH